MADILPLEARWLRTGSSADAFPFESSDELHDLPGGLGQDRAEEALAFGLAMRQPGYNVFVLGEPGGGRHATVFRLLREIARSGVTPPDLCYLHNFDDALRPRLLRLPAGRGARLCDDMRALIRELGPAVEAALGSDAHTARVEALQEKHKAREEGALREIGQECAGDGLSLLRTPEGFAFAPVREGEVLSPEQYDALPEEARQAVERSVERWSDRLGDLLDCFPGWNKALRDALARAENDALKPAVTHLMKALRERYADLPAVLAFFDAVAGDILMRGAGWRDPEDDDEDAPEAAGSDDGRFHRYSVSLLVDHAATEGAPVVWEDNPGYGNLVGRLEHVAQEGALLTHFSLIRAGALHRASGGYLVMDAACLLARPFAWEGLKRVLRAGEIRIEPPAEAQGWSTAPALAPEPAPCALKVVLVGDRNLFYLLDEEDSDFADLFKVAADFDDDLARTPDNEAHYVRLLAMLARASGLLPFDRSAAARLVEESARIAEDASRLSLQTRRMADLLREADYHARRAGLARIGRAAIEAALAARSRRSERYPLRVREAMLDGTTLISTSGVRAGQINGLVVVEFAGERHGHPVRITATVRMGDGDVVDIERETELGGAIHSKGVLILSAFLAARYARHQPLSLSASLVFEQSYDPVEGDSASLAELCALLSALTQFPIGQRYAITGSVNQFGEVQAIGGVNEKIEGFFDLCAARGLDGSQGVVIPAASVRHLMLREEVVEAAREGRFHVHAVSTVDQAMEILTGVPAGEADAKGVMPKGTLNHKIAAVLAEMAAARHAFADAGERLRGRGRH